MGINKKEKEKKEGDYLLTYALGDISPTQRPAPLGHDPRQTDGHWRVHAQRLVQASDEVGQLCRRRDVDVRLRLKRRPHLVRQPRERLGVLEQQVGGAREERRRRLGARDDEEAGVGLDVFLGQLLGGGGGMSV